MKIPTIKGVIDRRILINFTVDPQIIAKLIPKPFKPKIYKGKAIVGICLIRLKEIRPKGFPSFIGISSENGAHRIAVEWEENGEIKEVSIFPEETLHPYLIALLVDAFFQENIIMQEAKNHRAFREMTPLAGMCVRTSVSMCACSLWAL